MQENIKIVKTEDGSCTLYLQSMDETYHSTHGALGESLHVYIKNGLEKLKDRKELNILEIGFGTGLNALLTLDHQQKQQHINYYTIEPFPLDGETLKLYYQQFVEPPFHLDLLADMAGAHPGLALQLTPEFSFCLLQKTLQSVQVADVHQKAFDLVYYDAFGPSKQPEMWEIETVRKATDMIASKGILSTYCAQGQFKRNLKSLGLEVENPEGAMGKRQMTVAIKS